MGQSLPQNGLFQRGKVNRKSALIPANLELAEFEHECALVMARGQVTRNQAFYTRISGALARLVSHYDIVIMDSRYIRLPLNGRSSGIYISAGHYPSGQARRYVDGTILDYDRKLHVRD